MTSEGFTRKISAILSADAEGYSRLMGENEEETVRTIKAYREVMAILIGEHRGRVIDSPGDNLLAEFASVVDALRCAWDIQKEINARNSGLSEDRRMVFRIGINLGDVIEEEGRIYGDGVNVAARLEGLAEPGGISISGAAYEQVKNKLPWQYEFEGEQEVKNITEPVSVYRVVMEPKAEGARARDGKIPWIKKWSWAGIGAFVIVILVAISLAIWKPYFFHEPQPEKVPAIWNPAFKLPEKPSIAVLPFSNISGDPEQEYFSDGITEEIITGLSKVPRLFVIARNSTFTYKGKPVMVQQVGQELGVRYVLEGSVRKAKDRVRITAQLIDAMTGNHLWAEKYDRDLKDIFELQDEIMMKVIAALQVKLTEGEQALIVAGGTKNFEAYARFLKGLEYIKRFNREGNLLGRKMAEEAIALDPNYPRGYRMLATTHYLDVRLGISKSPKQSLARAAELYKKVIDMDPTDAPAHGFLGFVYTIMRLHEKGIAEGEKGVTLNPNAADAQCLFGLILHFNGKQQEAIEVIKKAIRLNPFPPTWYWFSLGHAYCLAGMYEEAIPAYKKAISLSPDNFFAHLYLAATYSLVDREEEAGAEVEEVLRINPQYCTECFSKTNPYKNPADRELIVNALLKAGLPRTPPLPLPDQPSIAVLPFVNMSGDSTQEYFSDGISEEIITALSKIPKLFVIARNSTFTYKGKSVWVPTVGRELGVRYVLEGSVRRAGERVRITAQLIDAGTNKHLWAERYDRDMKDVFSIQDEITQKVVTALQVKLTEGEQARVYSRGTNNLEAYLKLLKGREQMNRWNIEGNALARQTIKDVISIDPNYAIAYYLLAQTHHRDVFTRSTSSPKESIAKAIKLTQKAIALDDSLAEAHGLLGWLYTMRRQHEKGIAQAEQALALNPNSADTYQFFGLTLNYAGKHEEAIILHKKAIRLNPFPPTPLSYMRVALACRDAEHYQEVIPICRKILQQEPDFIFAHTLLASSYAQMGRLEEARAEAAEVLRIDPKFSVDYLCKKLPYKYDMDRKRVRDSLLKAGLPE